MADVTGTYYAGEAIFGYGTQLLVGDAASPESFEAIADVTKITPGKMSTEVKDKTHLRSPDRHREKFAGIRDSEPFTVTGNWRPTHQSQSNAGGGTSAFASGGLVYLWRTAAERNFKIVLPTATEWPFRGVVTGFQPGEISNDGSIPFTAEITPLQDFSANLP